MGSNLIIKVGELWFKNPIILASGILGDKASLLKRAINEGVGGIVTKSITLEPREGYKTPIIIGLKCGFLNAVGLANPGIDGIKELISEINTKDVPIIVSIAGSSIQEFIKIAKASEKYGADGIELNFSCPHVRGKGIEIGADPQLVFEIIDNVRREVNIPIFVKLGLSDNIIKASEKALEGGANALVLINTIKGMAIDVWVQKPILSNKFGGVSGCAIHPIAVRVVYEIYEEFQADIIGVGGVEDWEDAIEFILAGARAVQVGSAIAYKGYSIFKELKNGILNYLDKLGIKSIEEIVGIAHS